MSGREAVMRQPFALALACVAVACGGSSSPATPTSPTTPTPPTIPSPPPPAQSTVGVTLTATNGGQRLSGVAVSIPGVPGVTTDSSGQFTFAVPATTTTTTIEFSASSIVPRRLTLATHTRTVGLDAIQLSGDFSLAFYRQLVRNGFEQPGALEPLRRWNDHPKVYLRTVFGAGNREIDEGTLDSVAGAITASLPLWTGGA
jgi:hypothetical protein